MRFVVQALRSTELSQIGVQNAYAFPICDGRKGTGRAVVRISAWMRKDRYGRAMLTGATSYPLPGKSEIEQQDAAPTITELEAQGLVTRGMPEKAKKRSSGRGE